MSGVSIMSKITAYIKSHKKECVRILMVLCIIGLLIVILQAAFNNVLTLFLENMDAVRTFINQHKTACILLCIFLLAAQTFSAIIPAGPFQIMAGYAFGTWMGLVWCMVGSMLGSFLVMLFTKKHGLKMIEKRLTEEQKAQMERLRSSDNLMRWLITLYVIPGSPKDFLTYFAGSSDISIPVWMIASSFGRIPGILLSTLNGSALQKKDTPLLIATIVLTILITLGGQLVYKKFNNKSHNNKP